MSIALRLLLGVVIGTLALWIALYFYGLLAVWSPWPRGWWLHDFSLVSVTSRILAWIPFVIVLGFIFVRLFKVRPTACALVAMTLTILIALGDTLSDPELLRSTLPFLSQFLVPFLVGPPLIVYILSRLRSNQRLERP